MFFNHSKYYLTIDRTVKFIRVTSEGEIIRLRSVDNMNVEKCKLKVFIRIILWSSKNRFFENKTRQRGNIGSVHKIRFDIKYSGEDKTFILIPFYRYLFSI